MSLWDNFLSRSRSECRQVHTVRDTTLGLFEATLATNKEDSVLNMIDCLLFPSAQLGSIWLCHAEDLNCVKLDKYQDIRDILLSLEWNQKRRIFWGMFLQLCVMWKETDMEYFFFSVFVISQKLTILREYVAGPGSFYQSTSPWAFSNTKSSPLSFMIPF